MRFKSVASIILVGAFAACGDGGGGGGGNNPVLVLAKAASSGDNQTGTVAAALSNSFCVLLTEDGTVKAGGTVTWATTGGGSMSAPTTTTAADGTACSKLTLGQTSGQQTASAASSGASGSPLTFTATANPDAAVDLEKNGGDNQQGNINTQLAEQVSVKALDQFGNGVPNVSVDWAVISGAATLLPLAGNTDGFGVSNSTVTLGGTAGAIVITATSVGLNGSPHTFNATANNPPPPPSAITIAVNNFNFSPAVDTVAAGGTVTWTWATTSGPHTVTTTGSPSFVSDPAGLVTSPPAHSYGPITFNTPGTYYYYCTQHGGPGSPPSGMSGTIVVQ